MLTVACVKQGTLYDARYVNNLRAMVRRHLTVPFRFVCLTEDWGKLHKDIEVKPIPDFLKGWWAKLALFAPGTFDDRVLFFDLDTVILGNIDAIADYAGEFAMLRDFMFDRWASGVMAWTPSKMSESLWTWWLKAGQPGFATGDQAWIEQHLRASDFTPDLWQDLFPGAFVSYKVDCFYVPPKPAAKVVCFHGTPKPHECKRKFVTDAWHDKAKEFA